MRAHKRATVMGGIDVGGNHETPEMLRRIEQGLHPPKGRPKQKSVTVRVPAAFADMSAWLAREQGMTEKEFVSALLSDALHEVLLRVRLQHRSIEKQRRGNSVGRVMADAGPQDDDVPY